jgi:hypothetical protein
MRFDLAKDFFFLADFSARLRERIGMGYQNFLMKWMATYPTPNQNVMASSHTAMTTTPKPFSKLLIRCRPLCA